MSIVSRVKGLSGLVGAVIFSVLPTSSWAQDVITVPLPVQPLPTATSGNSGVCLISPQGEGAGGAIFSTRPVFVWKGATISRIELMDLTGNELAWSGKPELPVTQIAYHSTPLVPGHQYRWTLFGPTGENLGSATFSILPEDQRALISTALDELRTRSVEAGKSPAEVNAAVVDYLAGQGLWSDALTTAIVATPPAPTLGRFVRTTRDRVCPS